MKSKPTLFLLLVICFLVGAVHADWRFWRSKKTGEATTTTTVAPIITNPNLPRTTLAPAQAAGGTQAVSANQGRPGTTATNSNTNSNTNRAVAGVADPGLAIGIGQTGANIRNNAHPNRPNSGTVVGSHMPTPNSNGAPGHTGQGYRNWAAELTGAGDGGRPSLRLPTQGQAISSGGQQPTQGVRSSPSTSTRQPERQRPDQIAGRQPAAGQSAGGHPVNGQFQEGQQHPGSRPSTPTTNGPLSQMGQHGHTPSPVTSTTRGSHGFGSDGKPSVSTLNIGSLSHGHRAGSPTTAIGSTPQSRPGSPTSSTGGTSPTGERTWADVAGTGSRPQSPTPAAKPGTSQGGQNSYSGQPGHTASGQTQPSKVPVQPYGQPGHQGAQQLPHNGAPVSGAITPGSATASPNRVFSSNPTYSKGNTVTDEDLQKLSESLFIKDVNNANRYITVNLQKRTNGGSSTDEAPQPLLTVSQEALRLPTIEKVSALYNNYEHDASTNEYASPAERAEESLLIDTFLSTNVMSAAMRFLADKGLIRKDYYEYKDTLRRLWFSLYSRGDGKIGSSGFEHVFLSEKKSGKGIIGLHNWIYYNAEEVSRRANYLGYLKKIDLGDKASIVKVHLTLNGVDKPVTTLFIGTSPELEMALYTVCFFTRPESQCPVSLGGTPFNIITHKFRYRGKDLIGAAYPEF